MRKGSRGLHCHNCGKIVGWCVPVGRSHHGIPEVAFRMNSDGLRLSWFGWEYYSCRACEKIEFVPPYKRQRLVKIKDR